MQQINHSVKNLVDYNTCFQNKVIPDKKGRYYYDASNINFVPNVENIETNLILVDSSARNWDKEDNNDYTIYLNNKMQYVHSIELLDGCVPASGYMITEHNNMLQFQEEEDAAVSVEVPPGNYCIGDLLSILADLMTSESPNHYTYQCTLDCRTNKVTISTSQEFSLIFSDGTEVIGDRGTIETLVINPYTGRKELRKVETSNSRNRYINRSIGRVLGFYSVNLDNEKEYTGQMVYNLRPHQYLAIFVNTENSDDFKKIMAPSPDNGADGAFAMVSLNESSYNLNQVVDNSRYLKTFNPPINFSKIRIQIRTMDGHLYDFNGREHYLVFEVKQIFGREIIKDLHNLA
jgi:hypothetical protein